MLFYNKPYRNQRMNEFGEIITLTAIAVFAVSGVLAGLREDADILSLMVFGVVTALGGGTIRDMMLNVPVFWASELVYVWVALAASFIAFFVYRAFFTSSMKSAFKLAPPTSAPSMSGCCIYSAMLCIFTLPPY